MANIWRDVSITDQLGLYAGGGIGAGGYALTTFAAFDSRGASVRGRDAVSAFAWQAGGGVIYDLSDRVAIDLGYRFFAIDQQKSDVVYDGPYVGGGFATDVPYGTLL